MMKINFKCNQDTSFYINRDYITNAYFDDIKQFPILSVEQERELLNSLNFGKTVKEREEAKQQLVQSNLRFVISIAKKLGTRDTFLDLVSEGNIGLIKAIEKFDPKKDCKLITYAVSWIIAYIKNYQITQMNAVIPPSAIKLHNYVKNVTKQFLKENDRRPTQQEIADMVREKFDFTITNLDDVELTKIISIDEKYSVVDEEDTFEDSNEYNAKTSVNQINDSIEKEYLKYKLDFFLNKLTNREKEIVERSYGIGREQESYDTIAMDMKIGGERVRQICVEAVKKMKHFRKLAENNYII